MHAVCLDTYPPICYQTDTSHDIMRIIHAINKYYGEMKVGYSYYRLLTSTRMKL